MQKSPLGDCLLIGQALERERQPCLCVKERGQRPKGVGLFHPLNIGKGEKKGEKSALRRKKRERVGAFAQKDVTSHRNLL